MLHLFFKKGLKELSEMLCGAEATSTRPSTFLNVSTLNQRRRALNDEDVHKHLSSRRDPLTAEPERLNCYSPQLCADLPTLASNQATHRLLYGSCCAMDRSAMAMHMRSACKGTLVDTAYLRESLTACWRQELPSHALRLLALSAA